ncbi:unnamed protein product, partial [Iphiclides podalirius]
MTQSWKQNASCCIGALGDRNEQPELFSRSWCGGLSALYWRVPIFVWALTTTIWSILCFWGSTDKFLLYMTHWGLLLILIESFFGIIAAGKNYCELSGHTTTLSTSKAVNKRAKSSDYGSFNEPLKNENMKPALPWYLKGYWILYNISIPVAFLITVFYWAILNTSVKKINYAPNPVLDVMLHGVNSLVMLVELTMSGHPSRLLHIMQPLYFALVYLIFTLTYYIAGGLDPWGHVFIYPVLDWSKPEQTLVVAVLTGLFLALMHVLAVAIATARDLIARRCFTTPSGVYNDGFEP